jgi:hypothetical protein
MLSAILAINEQHQQSILRTSIASIYNLYELMQICNKTWEQLSKDGKCLSLIREWLDTSRDINTHLNHPSERTVRTDSCRFSNRSQEYRIWETLTLPTQENNLGKTHTNIHALVGFQRTIAMCVPYKTDCETTAVSNSLHLLLDTRRPHFSCEVP